MVEIKPAGNSPFIVGVTGHRGLDGGDLPRLRAAVTAFVAQLRQHLPDTELQFIVGMAAGADLLVAQTAIELGLSVDAVLPMPLEQYAADFDTDALRTLTTLLQQPRVRRIELGRATMADRAADPGQRVERDTLYSNLTDTLIRRSSLLLALWDGQPSALPGGTADTVLRYLGARTEQHTAAEHFEFVDAPADPEWGSRPVYWIPTARRGTPLATARREPCILMGIGDNAIQMQPVMPVHLQTQLELLNRYNRNFQQLKADGGLGAADSLLASAPLEVPPHERAALEGIDAQYAKADALAVYYQKRSDRLFALFGLMAFVMGVVYLVYEQLVESSLLMVAYLVILLASVGVYYRLQGHQWFAKHLVCRVIAETMRAKFYLTLAGADDLVDAEAVLTLSGIDKFRGFSWIGHVLKGVEAPDRPSPTAAGAGPSDHVDRAWIETQHRYFAARVPRLEYSIRRVQLLDKILFVVIIGLVVALALSGPTMSRINVAGEVSLRGVLIFSVGALAVLLGVLQLHQNKMATRELLWQYRNQLSHFSRARAQLARIAAPGRRREVLAALGKSSLMESYLWATHRYHREHEPPSAR